jgi:hypothetical protein
MPPIATSSGTDLQTWPIELAESNITSLWKGRTQDLPVAPRFHEVTVDMMIKIIGQIATIERNHGEDVALAVVEDLKRLWAKPHLSLVQ